jgi:hypothetical protein
MYKAHYPQTFQLIVRPGPARTSPSERTRFFIFSIEDKRIALGKSTLLATPNSDALWYPKPSI